MSKQDRIRRHTFVIHAPDGSTEEWIACGHTTRAANGVYELLLYLPDGVPMAVFTVPLHRFIWASVEIEPWDLGGGAADIDLSALQPRRVAQAA